MAVTQTTRMALTRWSAGTDPFTRAQMDDDHAQLEAKAAGFLRGTFATRPAAAAANLGFIYEATDTGRLYWSTGAAWLEFGGGVDHGSLTGLADDDHPQYLNEARGDARYRLLGSTRTVRIPHTWHIPGEVKVASGDTDYILPMFVAEPAGATVVLAAVRYRINSGTSVTFKMQVAGADATGFTALSATTTATITDPADVALADTDLLVPVVTAVSGTPKNMTVTAYLDYTF